MCCTKPPPKDASLTDEDEDSFEQIDHLYEEGQEVAESDSLDYEIGEDEVTQLKQELAAAKLEIKRLFELKECNWMKIRKYLSLVFTVVSVTSVICVALPVATYSVQYLAAQRNVCEKQLSERNVKYEALENEYTKLLERMIEAEQVRSLTRGDAYDCVSDDNLCNSSPELSEANTVKKQGRPDLCIIFLVPFTVLLYFLDVFARNRRERQRVQMAAEKDLARQLARDQEDMNTEIEMHAEYTVQIQRELEKLKKKHTENQITVRIENFEDNAVKEEKAVAETEKATTVSAELNQAVLEMLDRMEMLENKLFSSTNSSKILERSSIKLPIA